MSITTKLNKTFIAIRETRPTSHAATLALLGTSLYFVHEGAASFLPANLVEATTLAMVACEWLQWTALGRIEKLEAAKDYTRAGVLKAQAGGIGLMQVALYTMAAVSFAAAAGQNWGPGTFAFYGALALAGLFAGLNFIAKWTSCEQIATKRTAPTPRPAVVEPVAADDDRSADALFNVIAFNENRRRSQEGRDKLNFLSADETARSRDAIRQRRNRRKAA